MERGMQNGIGEKVTVLCQVMDGVQCIFPYEFQLSMNNPKYVVWCDGFPVESGGSAEFHVWINMGSN